MKVEWIEYKGEKILYSDFTGLNSEEIIEQFKYETNLILQQKEPILYLANYTDTIATSEAIKVLNECGKKDKHLVKKSAVIGINAMKSILMNSFNMISGIKARAFDDVNKAKEYLIVD